MIACLTASLPVYVCRQLGQLCRLKSTSVYPDHRRRRRHRHRHRVCRRHIPDAPLISMMFAVPSYRRSKSFSDCRRPYLERFAGGCDLYAMSEDCAV